MAELTLDSRPRLAPYVSFDAPTIAGGQWIVSASDVPVSRVSPAVVALLRSLDGLASLRELRSVHGHHLSEAEFLALMERFERRGLLEGAERRPPGRVVFRPPLTLQLATLRAPAVFARLDRVRRVVLRPWMLLLTAYVITVGVLALIAQAPVAMALLAEPLPLPRFLVVVGALVLATLLHEAAHGMTLAGYGILPRRAGIMLFYASPAFFVDVTNGWRLGDRRARVFVALAGPAVHGALGSAAAIVALMTPDTSVRDTLLILALASWSIVAVNLVPFVRFDGYLALMSALDIPNLRSSAIGDIRDAAAHYLLGAPVRPRRLSQRWALPFGALSVATPIVLIVWALDRIVRVLAAGGVVGAFAMLAVQALVAGGLVVAIVRSTRRLLADGARPARLAAIGASAATIVAVLGLAIPVQTSMTLGFVADGDSVLLVTVGDDEPALVPGAPLTLSTRGVLGHRELARSTLELAVEEQIEVPIHAVYPIEARGVALAGRIVGVADPAALAGVELPAAGSAVVGTGDTDLWNALWRTNIVRPLAVLGIDLSDEPDRPAGR